MSRPAHGRPRRVLFSHTDPHWGGDKAQLLELAAGLDRAAYEPLVVTTAHGPLSERCAAAGVPVRVLPPGFFKRNFGRRGHGVHVYYLRAPLALRALVRETGADVLHAHCNFSTVPMARAARWSGVPFFQHVHDMDRRWVSRQRLPALRRSRGVLAISEAVAAYLAGRGVPRDRVRVVYNGVHTGPFAHAAAAPAGRAAARAELGLAADEVAVGVFARLEIGRKGQEDAVRAAGLLARGFPGVDRPADACRAGARVRWFFVGEDEAPDQRDARALRALAAEEGATDRVQFVGYRRDVPALMTAMDVVAAPFRREGFGRVVVEAMAAGRPVVAYRDGALPELLADGREGFLVAPGDSGALAARVAELAGAPERRAAMGAAGVRRAAAFTHARFVADVRALYDAALAGAGARPAGA